MRPPVWQLVCDAMQHFNREVACSELKQFVLKQNPSVKNHTVDCQIDVCTVNSRSRINYGVNQRPRLCTSKYDFLFHTERGRVAPYDAEKHGQWEIYQAPDGVLSVRDLQKLPSQSGVAATEKGWPVRESPRIEEFVLPSCDNSVPREKIMTHDTNNEIELVKNISHFYQESEGVFKKFGGPSVYFHVQAIKEQQEKEKFMHERHIEMIYAVLVSWGMHQMGNSPTKLVKYERFKQSLCDQRLCLLGFRELKMDECTEEQYRCYLDDLKNVYTALKVSESNSTLVAHSKTLAHILPQLIPPIDRRYTNRFFALKSNNLNNCEDHFEVFKDYCVRIKRMFDKCDKKLFRIDPPTLGTFNTSYPKIMDNIIMAFVMSVDKPRKKRQSRNGNT
jgi:hypothetical protein